MDLKELKKEVHSIGNIGQNVDNFKRHYVKPIRSNTNTHLPFMNSINDQTKKQVNEKLVDFYRNLGRVKSGQEINDKLQYYTRYLIEMKLTQLRGHQGKSQVITNMMLNDDSLKLNDTISEIKAFEKGVNELKTDYHEINDTIHKEISLDETLFFMDLPHKKYLYDLLKTAQDQKKIVRQIGKHFIAMVKENHLKHKIDGKKK